MTEKKSGTFAKSFFGGFLGAVLALALGLGAYVLGNSGVAALSSFVRETASTPAPTPTLDNQTPWSGYQGGGAGSYAPSPDADGNGNDSGTAPGTPDTSSPDAQGGNGTANGNQNAAAPNTTILIAEDSTALSEVVAEKCLPSVVAIDIYTYYNADRTSGYGYDNSRRSDTDLAPTSLGSGVLLTADGYVLTNYHVIEGYDVIRVTAGGEEYEALLVGTDASSDLAVVKLQLPAGVELTPIAIGNSDALKVGQWVMTIGSPFGYEQSVADGIVSALGRSEIMTDTDRNGETTTQLYVNLIQTNAAINPGNSGGALVNAKGELVGINTLITSYSGGYSGVGFAIPVNYAWAIAQQIINGEKPTHASLGVSLVALSPSTAARYDVDVTSGVYVSRVYAGTGAEAAGIREGDVITAFEGKPMTSATNLLLAVRSHQPGDTVTVTVYRDGETLELQATLGSDAE